MGNNCTYISVILPLKLSWEPFYFLPEGMDAEIGDRVEVIFSGRKYIGTVSGKNLDPEGCTVGRILPVREIRTDKKRVLPTEIEFWRRIAAYYMCSVGQVYKAAYPSARNMDVKTRVAEERVVAGKEHAELSEASSKALQSIIKVLGSGKTALLSSGDSGHILAELCLRNKTGNTVWIVPELKMEKHIYSLLQDIFGSRLILWGPDMTSARKRKAEDAVRKGNRYIMLGTRSALFLPHHDLSLVIVGDEHDPSHKQSSPSPRYNGRDAAMLLASVFGASCVMESVTPSLESIYNCMCGKFVHIVQDDAPHPEFDIIDTIAETRKNGMCGGISRKLMECRPEVTAAYKPLRAAFPKTEELSDEISRTMGDKVFYTEDTVSNPFPEGCRNIAFFGADAMLGKSDFRADERLFQTIRRAIATGPSSIEKVLIQTREPEHPVFKALKSGDISPLLEERRAFSMPPYTRIVDIRINDRFADRALRMGGIMTSIAGMIAGAGNVIQGPDVIRILLKRDSSLKRIKQELIAAAGIFETENKYTDHLSFDVDPI